MTVQTEWRLALMFDTPDHDLASLARALACLRPLLRKSAPGHRLRMGVADRHPELGGTAGRASDKGWADVDGAIEVTVVNGRIGDIPGICAALRPVLNEISIPGSVDVMTGPVFAMVPVRTGATFLSLAFRHDLAISAQEFRNWWHDHHAGMAIPALGDELLAYDQVHVDRQVSAAAADTLGVEFRPYDAYDNLTWSDRVGYLHSISNPAAMGPLLADEVGFIDQSSRRSAIMTEIA